MARQARQLGAALCLLLPCGSATLVEVSVRRGAVLGSLSDVEAALRAASGRTQASAILLTFGGDELPKQAGVQEDAARLSALSAKGREAMLRREAACRLAILQSPVPVIALADGELTGAAAAFFLAASRRVCTQLTTYALGECRAGLCPGFGALDALAATSQPHVAIATALGALRLNSNDCMELSLATHYAPSEALTDLVGELRASPPSYIDVPLARRTASAAPPSLVPLFASERTLCPHCHSNPELRAEPSNCTGGCTG